MSKRGAIPVILFAAPPPFALPPFAPPPFDRPAGSRSGAAMLLRLISLTWVCCGGWLASGAQAAPPPRCVLHLTVYDAFGAPLSFVVNEVRGEGRTTNLLRLADPRLR